MWELTWAIIWHVGAGAVGIWLIWFCNDFKMQVIGAILVSIFILLKPW